MRNLLQYLMQDYQAKISEKKYLTLNTLEITVELISPDEILFKAGQYMEFVLPGAVKSYAILSVPDHNRSLKFCIHVDTKEKESELIRNFQVGDLLSLKGPLGNFEIFDFSRDIFFIAAGTAIAPFVSIIPDILSRGYDKHAKLLFGVKSEEDVFYFDKFTHLTNLYQNFSFVPLLSQPKSHWPGGIGTITTHVDVHYDLFADNIFYISGSSEMVKSIVTILEKKGHNPADIKEMIFA